MNQSDFHKLAIYLRTIKAQIPYVDIKPYSHNIINITLSLIAEQLGDDVAKQIIASTQLKNMGWGCWLKVETKEQYKKVMKELKQIKL